MTHYIPQAEHVPNSTPLLSSPGIRHLEYGANKEGYWGYDEIEKQVIDMLHCLETLYPGRQVVFELDHSAGHGKHQVDGLSTSRLNASWGRKQAKMRTGRGTLLTADDVGTGTFKIGRKDWRVYAGGVQQCQFTETCAPPHDFFDSGAEPPKYDIMEDEEQEDGTTKRVVKVPGYIGKAKGMRQLLLERGLYNDGMNVAALKAALDNCKDFKNELTALAKLLHDRGHILLMSPKAHPELAGVGIEYSWGFCKQYYRRHNKCISKDFRQNVTDSITGSHVTLARILRFARRSRAYLRAYRDIHAEEGSDGASVHSQTASAAKDMVEKLVRKAKVHRCTADQDTGYIARGVETAVQAAAAAAVQAAAAGGAAAAAAAAERGSDDRGGGGGGPAFTPRATRKRAAAAAVSSPARGSAPQRDGGGRKIPKKKAEAKGSMRSSEASLASAYTASMLLAMLPSGEEYAIADPFGDGLCYLSSLPPLPSAGGAGATRLAANGTFQFPTLNLHYTHSYEWVKYFLAGCRAGLAYATNGALVDTRFTKPVLEYLSTPDIGEQRNVAPKTIWEGRVEKCERLSRKLLSARTASSITMTPSEWRGTWVDNVMVAHVLQRRVLVVVPSSEPGEGDGAYNLIQIFTAQRLRASATKHCIFKPRYHTFQAGLPNPQEDIVLLHTNSRTHYKRIVQISNS